MGIMKHKYSSFLHWYVFSTKDNSEKYLKIKIFNTMKKVLVLFILCLTNSAAHAAPQYWHLVTHEQCVTFFNEYGFDFNQTWEQYQNNPIRCIEIKKGIQATFKKLKRSVNNKTCARAAFPVFLQEIMGTDLKKLDQRELKSAQNFLDKTELVITKAWPLKQVEELCLFFEKALEDCLLKFLTLKNKKSDWRSPLFNLMFASFKDEHGNNQIVAACLSSQELSALMKHEVLVLQEKIDSEESDANFCDEESLELIHKSRYFLSGGKFVFWSISFGVLILVAAAGIEYLMYEP